MAEALTQTQERTDERSPVDGLVEYLRAHPYKLDHSRQELAEKFGLDEDFVGDVLDTLRGSPNKLPAKESFFKAVRSTSQTVGAYLSNLYEEFTEKPVAALPVTLLLTVALMLIMRSAASYGLLPVAPDQVVGTIQDAGIVLGIALLLLHTFIYFRHGMMRYAMYGTAVTFAVSLGTLFYLNSGLTPDARARLFAGQNAVALLIGVSIIIAFFYFIFATVTSLGGGFYHTSRADHLQKRLTRQELIDRLFYLQEKLKAQSSLAGVRRRQTFVGHLRNTQWLPVYALVVGFVVGLITVYVRGSAVQGPVSAEEGAGQVSEPIMFFCRALTAIAIIGLGYLSGGIRRAFVTVMLMFAAILVAELIPFSYFGPDYFEYLRASGKLIDGLTNALILALVVGVGAHIDKRARVRQKLQQHDPAHVLAEVVEIQWRLNPQAASSCVVFVDVAGSTRMKADADPLALEYSFRAFHDFVANIATKRGGSVLSTAGDGAVLNFNSCAEALYAAKEIQTKIGQFNAITNRMAAAFRVRIGIHTGRVSAQLSDVPFNELIDIAAHVEKEAPVGGIAITQSVAESLADERTAALKEPVDGLNVYVVLNPTLVS